MRVTTFSLLKWDEGKIGRPRVTARMKPLPEAKSIRTQKSKNKNKNKNKKYLRFQRRREGRRPQSRGGLGRARRAPFEKQPEPEDLRGPLARPSRGPRALAASQALLAPFRS